MVTPHSIRSGPELFDAYLEHRESVGILNPPLQASPQEQSHLLANRSGDWMSRVWNWWLSQPGWFMGHGGRADALDKRLALQIWQKGDLRPLTIWEHPGEGMLYATLEDAETGTSEIIARRKAPDWVIKESETAEKFREREIADRRVVWRFNSPYLPPPPPAPIPLQAMMMSAGPPEFSVSWIFQEPDGGDPAGVRVQFGVESSPGPFTVWQHTTGDLANRDEVPNVWMPITWIRDRPVEDEIELFYNVTLHPASGTSQGGGMAVMSIGAPPGGGGGGGGGTGTDTKIAFARASLGLFDSDGDGLDDGYELWFFGDLDETASGDYDNDGITNLEEYQRNTNPTVADTDADGRKDGDEITLGTNPEWKDHPEVELEVTIVR